MDGETLLGATRASRRPQPRCFFGVVTACVLVTLFYVFFFSEMVQPVSIRASLSNSIGPSLTSFPRVIHFVDSSRPPNGVFWLTGRQACAVESAARNNPGWKIEVHSVDTNADLNPNDTVLAAVLSYPNVEVHHATLSDITRGTFASAWVDSGKLMQSSHPVVHVADFLRLFILWKHGGLYLDTDFVTMRAYDPLEPNFSVQEVGPWIASAAMAFDTQLGRQVANRLVSNFMDTFNPKEYAYNGPGLLTRVAQRICNTNDTAQMTRENCAGFHILPSKLFYPIGYAAYEPLFLPQNLQTTLEAVKDSFALHCWNKLIKDRQLVVGTQAALGVLAERHCPKVYSNCGSIF